MILRRYEVRIGIKSMNHKTIVDYGAIPSGRVAYWTRRGAENCAAFVNAEVDSAAIVAYVRNRKAA